MTVKQARRATNEATDDAVILAALQERMERIARGGAPNSGRFCGYCFARLNTGESRCKVCGRQVRDTPPADKVPEEVLRAYLAHWNKMRLWVNVWAFTGIFLAIVLAGLCVGFLPGAFKLLGVPVLLGGAWYFANLLGGGLGGHIGMKKGIAARARKWQRFQAERAADRS